MSKQLGLLYEFGEFCLDCKERLLLRDGKVVPLTPKVFETLLVLVQRSGHLVEKDLLMKEVWADAFVEEANLARNIWALRKALADDEGKCLYIETVPKLGYRFVAPVRELSGERLEVLIHRHIRARIVEEEDETSDVENSSDTDEKDRMVERHTTPAKLLTTRISATTADSSKLIAAGITGQVKSRRKMILVLSAVCLLLIIFIAAAITNRRSHEAAATRPFYAVAVMPFANTSGDPELEYVSDGITENLINRLSSASGLKMIAYNSVKHYKSGQIEPTKVGQELSVEAILVGSVAQRGDNLSVSAELVDVRDRSHIWGERYDRKNTDLQSLQKELAHDIANSLSLRFSGDAERRFSLNYSESPKAYQLYLKGRYFWNKRTEAGLRRGIEYFQKATDQDPNYALAYAGLADSYIMLANWNFAPPGEAYAKAKAAAMRALELDAQLAEAHTSLAYVTLLYEWDWPGAEKRFRQAIALNPNYASAHHFYSICLMTSGRQSEALAEIQRAEELDPLSLIITSVHGWILYEGRQFDQAKRQYTKTLEMDANYVPALLDMGTSYLRTGEYSQAIAEFEKARSASSENGDVLSHLGQAYALSGQRGEALKILHQLEQPSQTRFVSPWDLSHLHIALGNKAKAIELLERAADIRVGWVILLGVDPAFDSLRSEPRFEKLKQRVGIPNVPS